MKLLRLLVQWLRKLFRRQSGAAPHDEAANPPKAPTPTGPCSPKDTVPPRSPAPPVGLPFYTVYIPTLDGRFYYLSTTDYPAGEIVVVPFGPEDREIPGIVEGAQFFPYGKTPLPLWKMKYILDKAPEPIAEIYRMQKSLTSS